jgi:SAM-dependent methyltransferase
LKPTTYDSEFYASRHSRSVYSAQVITTLVRELVEPKSVADLGCGVGTWLKVFMEAGIEDVQGIEGNWVTDEAIVIPREKIHKQDITTPLKLERQFDLAVSLEVAEHIKEKKSDLFLDNLTALAPVILFSAAIPLQGGRSHVNEQWPEYWKEKFSKRNYVLIDCIRPRVWNDPRIEMWYAQNSFLYVRRDKWDHFPKLANYRGDDAMLSVVHPRFYEFKLTTWPIMRAIRYRIGRMMK